MPSRPSANCPDPQLSVVPRSVEGMDATMRGTRTGDAGSVAASGIGETLTQVIQALAVVDHDREHATDRERLTWLRSAQQLSRQADALYKQLVAEADDAGSTMRLHGTPTTSWLALDGQTSTREASGMVHARFEFLPPTRVDPERRPLPSNAVKRGAPHNRATTRRSQGRTPAQTEAQGRTPPGTGKRFVRR